MISKYQTEIEIVYQNEEVEVKIEYELYGDDEDGYYCDITVIENNTKFSTAELEDFLNSSGEIYEQLCQDAGCQEEEYELGYQDYLADRSKEETEEWLNDD